jgi:hypothetical protein
MNSLAKVRVQGCLEGGARLRVDNGVCVYDAFAGQGGRLRLLERTATATATATATTVDGGNLAPPL